MINYLIQVLLFQALFLAVYDFFLQKETFFKWNRIYLLVTPILSFLIPLLKFKSIQQSIPQEYVEQLPTVFLNPEAVLENTVTVGSSVNYLIIVFYIGVIIFSILFLVRLFQIINLIKSNKIVQKDFYKLVWLSQKKAAFSFFNYIFISQDYSTKKEVDIIQHEIIHCKQKHSIDLLVFELLKIVLWFNPLVYVYQKRITLLHEYISDAEVVKLTDKKSYFNTLLSETFDVENISFINQFYKQSFIKKRIAMITKNKSQKLKQLKYLLLVPLLLGMLMYSSCSDSEKDELLEMESILNEYTEITEGKYFDTEDGKVFVGKSLIGKIVTSENFTEKEKVMNAKFSNINNSIFEFQVVIDEKGERIIFFKTNDKALEHKSKWKYEEGIPVPFSKIENAPIFPGCEGTEEELRQCLQEKITQHVNNNFNTKLAQNLGLSAGVKRIFVMFEINKEGTIYKLQVRAPHKDLTEEAIRVVKSLPQMIPGKYDGTNVGVKYSLPIAFKVSGKIQENNNDSSTTSNKNSDIPFAVIEEVPVFPKCKGTEEELRICLQENITKHVNTNFNSTLANSLGLDSGLQRFFVMFKIDKEGNVTDVQARAPHKDLQEEAIRVVSSLPKMTPGKMEGENVSVKYSLPIAFKVE